MRSEQAFARLFAGGHRCLLFGDEAQVMVQVVDRVEQQLPQRYHSGFAVYGGLLPGSGLDEPQGVGHLVSGDCYKIEFLLQVVGLVAERLRIAETVGTEKQWPVHGHGAFHPVGKELLTVGDVADDFKRAPLAGDWMCPQFSVGHPGHGGSQFVATLLVLPNQVGDG